MAPGPVPLPGRRRPRFAGEQDALLERVGRGDDVAFAALYDQLGPAVFGLAKRLIRDPARAEEVAREVLLEVWRTASRFDSRRGSALTYLMTITHRRAVDVVRRDQSARNAEARLATRGETAFDQVSEAVTGSLERQQARRCLSMLTELQRESVTLAYYGGHTYAEVASLLGVNPATVKTRLRDGLIGLRECLGGQA